MVLQVDICQNPSILYLKYVQFIICQLHFNKVAKTLKKKKTSLCIWHWPQQMKEKGKEETVCLTLLPRSVLPASSMSHGVLSSHLKHPQRINFYKSALCRSGGAPGTRGFFTTNTFHLSQSGSHTTPSWEATLLPATPSRLSDPRILGSNPYPGTFHCPPLYRQCRPTGLPHSMLTVIRRAATI